MVSAEGAATALAKTFSRNVGNCAGVETYKGVDNNAMIAPAYYSMFSNVNIQRETGDSLQPGCNLDPKPTLCQAEYRGEVVHAQVQHRGKTTRKLKGFQRQTAFGG